MTPLPHQIEDGPRNPLDPSWNQTSKARPAVSVSCPREISDYIKAIVSQYKLRSTGIGQGPAVDTIKNLAALYCGGILQEKLPF